MSDKKANIRITLQPRDHDYRDTIDLCMDIDSLIGMVVDPVDHHCLIPPGTGLVPIYCVQECHEGLIKHRKGTAKYLADILTEKIMEILSKYDTIDGYSQEEWKQMHKEEKMYQKIVLTKKEKP